MRTQACRNIGIRVLAVLLTVVVSRADGAMDRSAETRGLAEALRSASVAKRVEALKNITKSGLTDPTLYDPIAQQLLSSYTVDPENAVRVDEVSWMCKALASSGLPQYKKVVQEVGDRTNSDKVQRYARQSLGLFEWYARRNAQMVRETEETRGLSPEVARLVNLLRSEDLGLKKDAAKLIARADFHEPRLFEVVKSELVAGTKVDPVDPEVIDCMSWLCKALGASGSAKYAEVLEKVAAGTSDERLAKNAREGLARVR